MPKLSLLIKGVKCRRRRQGQQSARTSILPVRGRFTKRADRTERRIHSEECNRVDWCSTLRYAATAKRRWEREIVRLLTLRKWVGTAFGTARLVEFALSADEALLFGSVGPFHHRRDAETICFVDQ